MGVIDSSVYIADGVQISGDVTIGEGSSVWYNSVLRSTKDPIIIGKNSNIQDGCVLHASNGMPIRIGDGVSVGHMALIHCCTIGDNTLVGMGSIIMNNVVVGRNCIIGAGSLITEGKVIPDGSLVFGRPAKVARELKPEEYAKIEYNAASYVEHAAEEMAQKEG